MNSAYVDTSIVAAVVFGEPGSATVAARLGATDRLFSSNLMEAELRAALAREGQQPGAMGWEVLSWFEWVMPDRALGVLFEAILRRRVLKGADLWHLACALYLRESISDLLFYSLDQRQVDVAGQLGLGVE